jgi:hypothetical protein
MQLFSGFLRYILINNLFDMRKLLSLTLLIAIVILLFGGCKKTDTAPALPPANSMSIDFSNFTSGTKSANSDLQLKGISAASSVNWLLAATTAAVWNTILTGTLVVPVAAFNKAIDNTPVNIADKTWQWKFSVSSVGVTYNARLTGEVGSSAVTWKMYISRDGAGAFSEFLWFYGTSALDGKSGQWILNHSQLFQEPLLQIDWVVTGTDIGNIKYTYIRDLKDNRTTDLFKNSYITYGLTSTTLNAFYTIHFNNSTTTTDFKDVYIEWSTTAHNGHIKAQHYYQDTNWHCWDGSGLDVTCN